MLFGKKKAPGKKTYDPACWKPVVRCSICTGEQAAGFKEKATGRFEEVMLIRGEGDMPVLVLTARSSEDDQLRAFSMGADDYLMKPFLLSVLKAHMEALLRRAYNKGKRREYGRILLEEESRKVYLDEKHLELTPREYEVLNFLTINEGIVLSRDRILDEVWGIDYHGTDRAVDTIIKQLRLKLGRAGSYISTIYGTGYRFEVTEDEDDPS